MSETRVGYKDALLGEEANIEENIKSIIVKDVELEDMPIFLETQKQELLEEANNEEKYLLTRASRHLKNHQVNMPIDLSTIPDNKEQLKNNMLNIAYLIASHNSFGLDVRYILEGEKKDIALKVLEEQLIELNKTSNIDLDKLLIKIKEPHIGDEVISVRLDSLESVKGYKTLQDREYVVALENDATKLGMPIPNYMAAAAIGLSLAALRVLKEKKEKEKNEYEILRKQVFKKFTSIYERYGVVNEKKKFSEEDLEYMVAGSPKTRLVYAFYFALPPIVKGAIKRINKYHEMIQLILQAA